MSGGVDKVVKKCKEMRVNSQKTRALAGSWNDMSDEDFNEFLDDIKTRRKTAFVSRRKRDASIKRIDELELEDWC